MEKTPGSIHLAGVFKHCIRVCLSGIFSLLCLVLAGQTPQAFLIKNKKHYKELKDLDFKLDSIRKYPGKYPAVDLYQTDNQDLVKGHHNSCMIIYYTDNQGNTIRHKDFKLHAKVLVLSGQDSLGVLNLTRGKHENTYYRIVRFRALDNIQTSDKPVVVNLYDQNKKNIISRFELIYNYFPGSGPQETVQMWYGAYEPDDPMSKYEQAHKMVRNLRDPMYLSLAPLFLNGNAPFEDEKGHIPYIMEGNFSMPFTILQGRSDQNPWIKLASASVDPEFTWRITRRESAPLLPLNTKVGITFHKSWMDEASRKVSSLKDKYVSDPCFKYGIKTLSFTIRHYSNGQEDSAAFYTGTDPMTREVNFNSGNFSTNYVKLRYMRSTINREMRQFSWGGGIQWNTPVGFEPDQRNTYGDFLISGTLMLKRQPNDDRIIFRYHKHHRSNGDIVNTPSLLQKTWRIDLVGYLPLFHSYDPNARITGDELPVAQYKGYTGNPFRYMGVRIRMIDEPLHNRSIGWFYQLYYGRDYLNIRYNLVTFSVMFGMTFQFHKDPLDKTFIKAQLMDTYDGYQDHKRPIINTIQEFLKTERSIKQK